jgi:hypothetical protein
VDAQESQAAPMCQKPPQPDVPPKAVCPNLVQDAAQEFPLAAVVPEPPWEQRLVPQTEPAVPRDESESVQVGRREPRSAQVSPQAPLPREPVRSQQEQLLLLRA